MSDFLTGAGAIFAAATLIVLSIVLSLSPVIILIAGLYMVFGGK